ncbi:MAG: GxxExxY protein [Phocaeicola sp.]
MITTEYDKYTYKILGAAMEVYNRLGTGFLESVYGEAFAKEMELQDIRFIKEAPIPIHYKGIVLEKRFTADFICMSDVIVEIKAVSSLNDGHMAQTINYLKATKMPIALLINFGSEKRIEYKRVLSKDYLASTDLHG